MATTPTQAPAPPVPMWRHGGSTQPCWPCTLAYWHSAYGWPVAPAPGTACRPAAPGPMARLATAARAAVAPQYPGA